MRPYNDNAAAVYAGIERWVAEGRATGWQGFPADVEDRLLDVADLCWRWMSDEEREAVNARAATAAKEAR